MKAILFDCDGTLVDSEYAHYEAWKYALSTVGGDLSLEEYYQYIGSPAKEISHLFAKKVKGSSPEHLFNTKRDYFHKLCQVGLPPILPTVEFLKTVAKEKSSLEIKIGVCSAARKGEIISHLKHLKIDHLMDIVLSGQEDLNHYNDPEGVNKPKPYIYLHAMEKLKVAPEETMVIEDSASGVKAGACAGCFTVAIPNPYTKNHDFTLADLYLESLSGMTIQQLFTIMDQNKNFSNL